LILFPLPRKSQKSYNIYGDKMETLKITVNLENKEEIHHPFNNNTLNPTLVNFLYDECLGSPKNRKIDIHILTETTLTSEEKEEIRDLIHKHFKEEKKEIQIKKEINHIMSLCLLFLGIIFLIISFLINQELIEEIFLILGWIAIWEVTENILFERSKESLRIYRYKGLSSARIYFKEDSL